MNMKYTKEDFNYVWKDSTRESILNQFYYEHILLHDYMNVCAEIKKMLTSSFTSIRKNINLAKCVTIIWETSVIWSKD